MTLSLSSSDSNCFIVEQDHRFIKKRTKPMLGFKSFRSAAITITGIEDIRMIQKKQITGANNNFSTFENFVMLMCVIYTTNSVESVNSQLRKVTNNKRVFLAIMLFLKAYI